MLEIRGSISDSVISLPSIVSPCGEKGGISESRGGFSESRGGFNESASSERGA